MFSAGAVLTLAFPEPDLAPLAWIAIAPLLWAAHATGFKRGAWLGFLFGLGYFSVLLIWVKYVGWVAWGAVTVLQALFLALFGALLGVISKRVPGPVAVLTASALWVVVECLRQELPVFGFTWGQLAQSQHNAGWILRLAALTGGWGIAFLLVTVNGLVASAARSTGVRSRSASLALGALLICAPVLLPAPGSGPPAGSAKVAIVQGNVPRAFTGTITDKNLEITTAHARLTRSLEDEDVDLVVWPESSVGEDLNREPIVRAAIENAARTAEAEMIVGGNEDEGPGYRVMAYHFAPSGELVDSYQKTRLIPFGEYVPWRSLFGRLSILDQVSRDARPGRTPKVFDTAEGPVAPVISFEGDFGSLVRERIGSTGGRLLVVATNTSTWATSWASAQHLAFSQVRAAENGVWVVHAALSGISAFVDPAGTVVDRTGLWTEDTLVATVAFARKPSFYARTGDWLVLLCALVTIAALVASNRRRTGSVAG